MSSISNSDDIIDSRDVIARIEELRDAREDYEHDADGNRTNSDWATGEPEDAAELAALEALAAEASGYASDWEHGETLIRDDYFKTYAMELAEEIGAVDANASWPNTCIDWDQAARELRMDYTGVEFDGVTYWTR
jgi:hypothetical protein